MISYLITNKTLSLEDEIDKYLDLKIQTPTIEQLLTHKAYRPFVSLKYMIRNLFKNFIIKNNPYHKKTNKYLINYVKKQSINKEKEYFYSDINYAALGLIIEKISNDSYYNIMNEFISKKLKLKNTKFSFDAIDKLNSYNKKKKINNYVWNKDDAFISAGALSTNIIDALDFIELNLKSEKEYILNSHKSLKKILLNKFNLRIGYAWHIGENGNYYYHRGAIGCNRAIILFNKKHNIGVVILANCIGNRLINTNKLAKEIYNLLKLKS